MQGGRRGTAIVADHPRHAEPRSRVLWGRAFRPFFLLAGTEAVVVVGLWLGMLRGLGPVASWATPFQWHAHEMLFGFAGAAIAGFLLTSVPVWTGRPATVGGRLAAFAALWGVGRLAVFFAAALPSPWIVAAIDVSFCALLAVAIGSAIYGSGSRRNYAFPALLGVLALANLLTHLGAMGAWPGVAPAGLRLGVGVVVVLVSTLGGRLIPLFTDAALKRSGVARAVSRVVWADRAAGPLLAAFFLADTAWPDSPLCGALALAAAATLCLRAKGWGLRDALRDPLLWSMHVAYLWIPVGLVVLAATAFSDLVTRSLALHALTVGAIGGMILAIMTRVALGHTGRPFRAPRGIALAYGLVLAAALARTLLPALLPAATNAMLLASGALWIVAFAIFLAIYTPFLMAPRVDGKPG